MNDFARDEPFLKGNRSGRVSVNIGFVTHSNWSFAGGQGIASLNHQFVGRFAKLSGGSRLLTCSMDLQTWASHPFEFVFDFAAASTGGGHTFGHPRRSRTQNGRSVREIVGPQETWFPTTSPLGIGSEVIDFSYTGPSSKAVGLAMCIS